MLKYSTTLLASMCNCCQGKFIFSLESSHFDHLMPNVSKLIFLYLFWRILDHTRESRSSIQKELEGVLKLCRWERIENHLAIENFKRTRLKLRKIVKKYTVRFTLPFVVNLYYVMPPHMHWVRLWDSYRTLHIYLAFLVLFTLMVERTTIPSHLKF